MTKEELEYLSDIADRYDFAHHDYYGHADVEMDKDDAEIIRKAVKELEEARKMTREEAKRILEFDLDHTYNNESKEALRMAIKALEQETDRTEYGTDGNPYKLTISNGKEYKQEPKFIARADGAIEPIKNCDDCTFRKEWEKIGKLVSVVLEKQTEQEPQTNIALERYKDLQDYFSDKDIAKAILENQTEFKAWLERLRWNTTKVDELARKLEALEHEPKTEWIPVSERLPETDNENRINDHNVLLWVKNKSHPEKEPQIYLGKLRHIDGDDGSGNFWGIKTKPCDWTIWGWSYFYEPEVIAWQPLPEPYKEIGGENE